MIISTSRVSVIRILRGLLAPLLLRVSILSPAVLNKISTVQNRFKWHCMKIILFLLIGVWIIGVEYFSENSFTDDDI